MKRYPIAAGVVLTLAVLLLLPSANALAAAKPSVSLKAAAKTVTVGQTLLLKGTVGHPRSGAKSVTILERVGTKWQKLATARLSSRHAYKVTVKLTKVGTWRLETQYKAGGTTVHSKVVTITVNGWASISCGFAHTAALKTDGSLWAWGDGDNGQLGLGGTAEKNSPVRVDPGSTWKSVSCGYDYTLAIKSNGSLWAWGDNGDGQLGLGDTAQKDKPTEVDPGSTWTAVSAGYNDTVAIQSNGTLWAWGDNGAGELGLNNENETNSPTQVGSLDTWTAVACGSGYTMAIQSGGSLWGSGDNMRGELGLGSSNGTDTFAHVGSDTWTAAAVSGTDWYTLALRSDGTLWACGHNDAYQLGLGDTTDRDTLTQVGTDSTWKTVSAGYGFNLAVQSDGSLWAWGDTTSGNLGLGHMDETRTSPTRVGTGGDWSNVACGYEQTMALRSDGSLWACGDNFWGDLGLGSTTDKDTLTEVGGAA